MIRPEDLRWSPYPAERKGGQQVGWPSGVQVEHLPTGIIAIVQTDRSQHRNREIALHMIESALTDPKFRG